MMLRFCHITRACNVALPECGGNYPGTEQLSRVAAHQLVVGIQLVIGSSRIVVRVLNVAAAEDEVIESASWSSRLIGTWKILLQGKRDLIESPGRNLVALKCRSNVASRIIRVGSS